MLLLAATRVCAAAAGADKDPRPVSSQVLTNSAGMTEVGLLADAPYRIDIPAEWNHSLIVYYHGYAEHPVTFHIAEKLEGRQAPLFERHYAIVQSGYSQTGWALQQAYPETEALRKYFVKKYGPVRETYVAGVSMGGMLLTVTLELNPKPYVGGLNMCGSVGPTYQSFNRRFALRAAFDHYFPGILPPLVITPPDYDQSQAMRDRIYGALKANPQGAAIMRTLTSSRNDTELAWLMDYFTFNIADMQHRAKGNPFDNRNYLYTGTNPPSTAGDYELNDKVKRYEAWPEAQEYLVRHFTPSGRLGRPVLALHTLYDQLVPPTSLSLYQNEVNAAGAGNLLVQQYVHREGHCNFTEDEIGRAFDELVAWTHGHARPEPGLLPEPAPSGSPTGHHVTTGP